MKYLVTAAATAVLALAACGGGESELTAREITDEELSLMVLSLVELGPQYADFQLGEESGFQSNEDEIEEDFDPEDEVEDIERFGRLNGYAELYLSPGAEFEGDGPFVIGTTVHLLEEADGASGYLKDAIEDVQATIGATKEGGTLEDVEEFEVEDIGDEAVGLSQTLSVDSGQELIVFQTVVGFRLGRLLGFAHIARFDDGDIRNEVATLARKLEERILAVLQREVVP